MVIKNPEWEISDIARSAQKNIEDLDSEFQSEVIKRFESLQKNPFEDDIKKVKGKRNVSGEEMENIDFILRLFPN